MPYVAIFHSRIVIKHSRKRETKSQFHPSKQQSISLLQSFCPLQSDSFAPCMENILFVSISSSRSLRKNESTDFSTKTMHSMRLLSSLHIAEDCQHINSNSKEGSLCPPHVSVSFRQSAYGTRSSVCLLFILQYPHSDTPLQIVCRGITL